MKFTEYVKIKHENGFIGCALWLDPGRNYYWRAAGAWGVEAKFTTDRKLFTLNDPSGLGDPVELVECTEAEWREDNYGYV